MKVLSASVTEWILPYAGVKKDCWLPQKPLQLFRGLTSLLEERHRRPVLGDGQDWVSMIALLCRHRLAELWNCTMRCVLSVEATSPLGDTFGVEGDASAVTEMIFPDSRALVNVNAILGVDFAIGPLGMI